VDFCCTCRRSPATSASRITGSNPASAIRFWSSKVASTAPAVCKSRILQVLPDLVAGRLEQHPFSQVRGHLSICDTTILNR
jgi:hypothetical protein